VNEREFDAIKLLDYGYKYKKKFTLFEKDSTIRNVSVLYGKKRDVDLISESDVYVFAESEEEIQPEIIIYRDIVAPLTNGDKVGEVIINNKSFNILVKESIESVNWFKRIWLRMFD
jgi:D-alanyl-D-alanine carboxypeptidase